MIPSECSWWGMRQIQSLNLTHTLKAKYLYIVSETPFYKSINIGDENVLELTDVDRAYDKVW